MSKFEFKRISNVVIMDLNTRDYPDLVDGFVDSADYDGVPMTEEELDELNEDSDLVYELKLQSLE